MAPFPVSFNVSEHASKASASDNSEQFRQLGATNEAKAFKQLRVDVSLTVQLAETPSVTLQALREALPLLNVGTWLDIITERHLLGRCAYPTCSRAPSRPYSHASRVPQLKLTANGKILDVGDKAPFCSVGCMRKAKFLERTSLPQRTGLLWEDVADAQATARPGTSVSSLLSDGAPPSSPGSNDLIANLPIVERPTEAGSAPRPGQADFEARSHTRPIPRPQAQRSPAAANTQRRFILNKRMRTRASAPSSPSLSASTSAEPEQQDTEDPPSLEGLSLYDQAVGNISATTDRIQDDMNDEERAIWMAGRALRDQLREQGELE